LNIFSVEKPRVCRKGAREREMCVCLRRRKQRYSSSLGSLM
jgi:hypothetical protein